MGTAASPFLNTIAAELEGVGPKRTAKALSRRARQRRQIQGMIAASYVIDALVLLIYARAGTVPATIALTYTQLALPLRHGAYPGAVAFDAFGSTPVPTVVSMICN